MKLEAGKSNGKIENIGWSGDRKESRHRDERQDK